jgi:hypothetical protein
MCAKDDTGDRDACGFDWEAIEREIFGAVLDRERARDRERMDAIRRRADRIASMILYSDMPRIDIDIAIGRFRDDVLETFPDKAELFEALYANRFDRLWNQFRESGSS